MPRSKTACRKPAKTIMDAPANGRKPVSCLMFGIAPPCQEVTIGSFMQQKLSKQSNSNRFQPLSLRDCDSLLISLASE